MWPFVQLFEMLDGRVCNKKREKGKRSESSIDCLLSEVGWAEWETCPVSPLSQLVLNI